MSRSVVRRRAADRPEDTAPQPQVLRRRAAVIEEPAARRVAREPEPAAPAPEPEVARVETPAPVQERPAPVEAAPVVEHAP
ncbi:MAG: hypothetical protein KC621_31200, partial [Myxococcales bacterium]|nr:hypothetical protein [Myxococcales bacterium]